MVVMIVVEVLLLAVFMIILLNQGLMYTGHRSFRCSSYVLKNEMYVYHRYQSSLLVSRSPMKVIDSSSRKTNDYRGSSILQRVTYRNDSNGHLDVNGNDMNSINYGIKYIDTIDDIMILWKASNVGLKSTDVIHRPAAIAVESYVEKLYHQGWKSSSVSMDIVKPYIYLWTTLTAQESGLLLVALSKNAKQYLESSHILNTYVAVIYRMKRNNDTVGDIMIANDGWIVENLKAKVLNSSRSINYGTIYMVELEIDPPRSSTSSSTSLQYVHDALKKGGYDIVDYDIHKPYITLMTIQVKKVNPICNRRILTSDIPSHRNDNSAHQNSSKVDSFQDSWIQSIPIPNKFIKFMKREELFYNRSKRLEYDSTSKNDQNVIIRRNDSDDNGVDCDDSDDSDRMRRNMIPSNEVNFKGFLFKYPAVESLKPRASTEVMVDAVLTCMSQTIQQNKKIKRPMEIEYSGGRDNSLGYNLEHQYKTSSPSISVLDLGTSSGAIIISSILNHLHDHNNEMMRTASILGVGIDINEDALTIAVENAKRLLDGISVVGGSADKLNSDDDGYAVLSSSQLSLPAAYLSPSTVSLPLSPALSPSLQLLFKKHNYNNLHSLSTFLLEKYSHSTPTSPTSPPPPSSSSVSYSGFDVIVCNPPYLSQRANKHRITTESTNALVGGVSGYEAYDDICKSIQSSYRESRRNRSIDNINQNDSASSTNHQHDKSSSILKYNGYLLFQLSAATKSEATVTSILKRHNFEVVSCMKDLRGMPRCIISKMIHEPSVL